MCVCECVDESGYTLGAEGVKVRCARGDGYNLESPNDVGSGLYVPRVYAVLASMNPRWCTHLDKCR